jgi:hypothetical protein
MSNQASNPPNILSFEDLSFEDLVIPSEARNLLSAGSAVAPA